jgi:hypothetical protein
MRSITERYRTLPGKRYRERYPLPTLKGNGNGNAHEEVDGHGALPECPGCGQPFTPTPARQRFCRPSCRARWEHRQARRAPRLPGLLDLDVLLVSELPAPPSPTRPRPRKQKGQ